MDTHINRLKVIFTIALPLLLMLSCQSQNDNEIEDIPIEEEMMVLKAALSKRTNLSQEKLLKGSIADDVPLYLLPFQNPPERNAENGLLNTELNIAYAKNKLYNVKLKKNITVDLRSYENSLVGPTLRVKQGDLLRVKLKNNLPPLYDVDNCDPFKGHMHSNHGDDCDQLDSLKFNTTNLHTHGLHVSPKDSSDNVLIGIEPGCEFQNHIEVPKNHPAGTFWYHAHVHGSTAIQVSSGMGGALIVEGGLDTVPEIAKAEEKIFVLQQMPYLYGEGPNGKGYVIEKFKESFGPDKWQIGVDKYGWRTTINGQTYPVITMKSGAVERWRFIHAGVRETLNIKLQKHSFHELAQDGIALGRLETVKNLEMQPGYRHDVLIKANTVSKNDTLFLIDDVSDPDEALQLVVEDPKVLAVVIITPETDEMSLPESSSLAAYAPFKTITEQEVQGEPVQDVTFNIQTSPTLCFTVNGKPFSMNNPPRLLKLNTANDWVLGSDFVNHPYHIHVNHFEIFRIEHPDGTETVFNPPLWKDTYMVQQGDRVHVRSRYTDFDGAFVLHCHILDHEDQGMMEMVKIVDVTKVQ